MAKRAFSCGLCVSLGLASIIALFLFIPAKAGIIPQTIELLPAVNQVGAEKPPIEIITDTVSAQNETDMQERLGLEIEDALHRGDRMEARRLAEGLPVNQREALLQALLFTRENLPEKPTAPVNIIGINGSSCAYDNFPAAIAAASPGGTLYVKQGTHDTTIGLVDKNLKIVGANSSCALPLTGKVEIDANDKPGIAYGGVIQVDNDKMVTLTNLTLMDGTAIYGGIAYLDAGAHLNLEKTILMSGTATILGGGLRLYDNASADLFTSSKIIGNSSAGVGGGVAVRNGTLVLHGDSRVGDLHSPNTAGTNGGGIHLYTSQLQMQSTSRVRTNEANDQGGGIFAELGSTIEMHDSSAVGGTSSSYGNEANEGGGIYLAGSGTRLEMDEDSYIRFNSADDFGGGIYATNGATVDLSSVKINDNDAGEYGGGIYVTNNATVLIDSSQVNNNQATVAASSKGGGILVSGAAIVTLSNLSEVKGNQAGSEGGGLHILGSGGVVTITNSSVISNTADANYGGIGMTGDGRLTLEQGADISWNRALSDSGGGIGLTAGSLDINYARVFSNTAFDGGGIYIENGSLHAVDADIRSNVAEGSGGGIYRTGGEMELEAVSREAYIAANRTILWGYGGGIYDDSGGDLVLRAIDGYRLFIRENETNFYGGGIYAIGGTQVEGYGWVQVSGNEGSLGGGIYLGGGATLWMEKQGATYTPEIWGNTAEGSGGGISASNSGQVELSGAIIGAAGQPNRVTENGNGGGIHLNNSNLELVNTLVQYNSVGDGTGGGIFAYSSTVTIRSSFPSLLVMSENDALATPLSVSCDPVALPADHYCSEIRSNSAGQVGGGIYIGPNSIGSITHTALLSNTSGYGSALAIRESSVTLDDSLVQGNTATDDFYHNTIWVDSGGVDAILNARHNTIAGNNGSGFNFTYNSQGHLENNIVWDNSQDSIFSGSPTAACNNTQEDEFSDPSNISLDPQFITTGRGAYRLGALSPVIDACSSGNAVDLDGLLRPFGADYDMGAFESIFDNWISLPLILR